MTAAEKILSKALAGSALDSRQWSGIQAGLRDRALFSSQVENMRVLHAIREKVASVTDGRLSTSEMRRDLREALAATGYNPGESRGTIKDLLTKRRLDTILDVNKRMARGYVQHLEATTQGALKAFPAYELVRVIARRVPRDWHTRWTAAGGETFQGRMIALKTDPIWATISRFGEPHPPFDYNSGMGVQDVSRQECLALGVIDADTPEQTPPEVGFNGSLQAEIPFRDDSPEASHLKDIFGDQITFSGNVARWRGEIIGDLIRGNVKKVSLGIGYNGEKTSISHSLVSAHIEKHIGENETHGNSAPLEHGDFELIPTLWRRPDRVSKGHSGHNLLELDMLDGHTLVMVTRDGHGPLTIYKKEIRQEPQGAMHAYPVENRP